MSGWHWGEEEGGRGACVCVCACAGFVYGYSVRKLLYRGDMGSRRAEGNYAPSGCFGMLHKT